MDIDERNKLLEVLKVLTGSVMSYDEIILSYNSLTPPKRTYVYSRVNEVLRHDNTPFDKAQPLIVVSINVIAAEENIDPAVVLLIYTNKKNRKAR